MWLLIINYSKLRLQFAKCYVIVNLQSMIYTRNYTCLRIIKIYAYSKTTIMYYKLHFVTYVFYPYNH